MSAPTSPDRPRPNGHAHSPSPPAPDGGRDDHGRFAKGNAGGPGNPFARQVAALRCAFVAALTPQDIAAVTQALLRQAHEGNVAAAKLLLSYGLGRPAAAVDPDTLDLHEFGLYRALPDPGPDMVAAGTRMGLPFALNYLRTALPGFAAEQERQLADGIADQVEQERRLAAARGKRRAPRQDRPAPQSMAAPAPPAGAVPPDVAKALEILADDPEALALFLSPPGAPGGPATPCQPVTPPSPNGTPPRRRPGGPKG